MYTYLITAVAPRLRRHWPETTARRSNSAHNYDAALLLTHTHTLTPERRYQQRRIYTRIALGKNTAMDVVSGESSGGRGQLLLLYPLLFALQGWQVALGASVVVKTAPALLLHEGWLEVEALGSDLRSQRGLFLVGCAMTLMGLMNFRTTVATILEKRRYLAQKQRRASAVAAARGGSGSTAAAAATNGGSVGTAPAVGNASGSGKKGR